MNPLHFSNVRAFFRRWQAADVQAFDEHGRLEAMRQHPSNQPPDVDDGLDPVTRIRRTCSVCFGALVIVNPNTGAEYPCDCNGTGRESERVIRKAMGL